MRRRRGCYCRGALALVLSYSVGLSGQAGGQGGGIRSKSVLRLWLGVSGTHCKGCERGGWNYREDCNAGLDNYKQGKVGYGNFDREQASNCNFRALLHTDAEPLASPPGNATQSSTNAPQRCFQAADGRAKAFEACKRGRGSRLLSLRLRQPPASDLAPRFMYPLLELIVPV